VVTAEDITKKGELKGQLDALFDKFADGDLSKEEFNAQKKPLEDQLEVLQGNASAQIVLDAQYNRDATKSWHAIVAASLDIAKGCGGIDYRDPANKAQADELDAAVKRFGQAAGLMHPDKPMAWRDKWALAEAHKDVATRHGKPFVVKGAAAPAPTAAPRAAPDLGNVPPTLRGAPAAGDANINADEFARIDAMTPAEAEKAVAMMTPEQEARYLAR
jgi:hypothetical protein